MANQIYPCLWFDGQAKAAAEHYCSIFKNSKITFENSFVVNFELNGTNLWAWMAVQCINFHLPIPTFRMRNTGKINHYWDKLGEGGIYKKCGRLDDKFGVTWQIVPRILGELMADPEKVPRVMEAFMQMTNFEYKDCLNA